MSRNYAHIFPIKTPFKPSIISVACAVHCVYWKELYGKQEQYARNNPQGTRHQLSSAHWIDDPVPPG